MKDFKSDNGTKKVRTGEKIVVNNSTLETAAGEITLQGKIGVKNFNSPVKDKRAPKSPIFGLPPVLTTTISRILRQAVNTMSIF